MNQTPQNPAGALPCRASNTPTPSPEFRFSSGNAGMVQRKIINHLLALAEQGFDRLPAMERLEMAGTDAIRKVCAPAKNPMEHISRLRALNGGACIVTIGVQAARNGKSGKSPGYYSIPMETRQAWRYAVRRPKVINPEAER
ncbi:hypothetical protein [Thiothrix nivea]|uniref:Uncharacterized protein n=1 Tax=Thiothrix nivea (strain ATCC 35100 / DSM 5205 / JP2) TaxID=870187 RepID=A0A656HC36_THINJ|nr:hypothetical protein [Thiothrix nivea]EIJ33554.1 hypothetical protein Thini_0929 [Thiothrix nivea DSM 5205]